MLKKVIRTIQTKSPERVLSQRIIPSSDKIFLVLGYRGNPSSTGAETKLQPRLILYYCQIFLVSPMRLPRPRISLEVLYTPVK